MPPETADHAERQPEPSSAQPPPAHELERTLADTHPEVDQKLIDAHLQAEQTLADAQHPEIEQTLADASFQGDETLADAAPDPAPAPAPDPAPSTDEMGPPEDRTQTLSPADGKAAKPRPKPVGFRLSAGVRFGPVVTVSPIGQGGMGEVWLARNEEENRDEALKILLHTDPGPKARERFMREGQAAMQCGDAKEIVQVYEVGEQDGKLFIRMEYVQGTELADLVRKRRPEPEELLPLFKGLAGAVAVGHRMGIIHRDIKPGNFMVTEEGQIKLLDFGIARLEGSATLTATGEIFGTPAYMSLEQWAATREVDKRADVYSLGVVFYHLVRGELPYDVGTDPTAYFAKVRDEDPKPFEPTPGVSPALQNLILKAMAKDPEERVADAVELLETLQRIDSDPTMSVIAPKSVASRRRAARRRKIALTLVGVVLIALLSVFGSRLLRSRGELSTVATKMQEAREAGAAAEQCGLRAAYPEALQEAEQAVMLISAAMLALSEAKDTGAEATRAAALEQEVEAMEAWIDNLKLGLLCLEDGRTADAETAFRTASGAAPDRPAPKSLLERASRMAASKRRFADAEAALESNPLRTLDLLAEEGDALDPERVATLRARATAKIETFRAAEIAAIEQLIGVRTEDAIDTAEARIEALAALRVPEEEIGRLRSQHALTSRQITALSVTRPNLDLARAAEAEEQLEEAAGLYVSFVEMLRSLAPEDRAYVSQALEVEAGAIEARIEELQVRARIAKATHLARSPGEARAAYRAVRELRKSATSPLAVRELETALAALRDGARDEAKQAAETALAGGDLPLAFQNALDAVRIAPEDSRARDFARFTAALRADQDPDRVIVPPVVMAFGEGEGVYVPPFAIDRFEVTNAAYQSFLQDGGYEQASLWAGVAPEVRATFVRLDEETVGPGGWEAGEGFPPELAAHPVAGISLYEARAFARSRSGRLPAAAEWTAAAGYDPAQQRVRTFPWGDADETGRAGFDGAESPPVSAPGLDRSALGIVGLGGSVREWIDDDAGAVRGGSAWDRGDTAAARIKADPRSWSPGRRADSVGFRCAYDLPEPPELQALGQDK